MEIGIVPKLFDFLSQIEIKDAYYSAETITSAC